MRYDLTPEDIIFLKYDKLEDIHKNTTADLGWGRYTDVLYSFLGIFTLGIYIYENEKSKYTIGNDNVIRIAGTRQCLYSRKYISTHFGKYSELAKTDELKKFANVYSTVGNIIPIWPGGNEFKGKMKCYDIPDIFFDQCGEMEKVYIEHVLKKKIEDAALTRFIPKTPKSPDIKIEDIFYYDIEKYKKFVRHIVKEIEMRTIEIEKLLK